MADNVHVAIRVRPLINRESGHQSHWKYDRKSISLIGQNKPYIFDRVFAQDEVTEDVYREIAQPIVQASMNGYSGTIFAYGQTSSGKTYTMQGDDNEPGIIPKAINELFEIIENTPKREFLFRVSYMELYNEVITDLLVEEKDRVQLIIRENEQKKIFVSNLIEEVVTDADAVLNVMNRGNARRHIGQTNMNEHSSRSHTIFKLTIESCEKGDAHDSMDLAVKVSELNLIDLAGSERANETKAQGLRLKEAGNINRSLFALCNVISKLSAGADFIPFRDSKLTRILQSALGGNSKTAVICTVTPVSTDQTDSTLQFASRAKTIQTKPEINEILTGEAQIQRCQKEIKSLRSQLELYQQGMPMQDQDRIAQLEEEKSVQQEKIKQLQSMILVSKAKPVASFAVKKKRRMTWCPGKLGQSRRSMLDDPMLPLQKLKELEEVNEFDAVSLPNQSFRAGADFSFSMAAELPEEYSPVTKRSRVVMWADNTSAVATQTEPPEDSTSQEKEAESKRLQETFAICDALLKDKEQMEKQIMESSVELTSLRGTISTLEFENVKLASENEGLRHFIEDTVSTNDFEDNEKLMLEEYQHELTEIIGSLKQELQQSQQSKAEIEIQLGADKSRLERRVNELTAQLQQAYDDHSEASNGESEIVSENQQLTQELEGTTEAFQLAKEELESLKEASAKHLEEMTQQRQAFQGLEADLADARRNVDGREEEWKALLAEKSSELDTNREELTHARLELQNKETESKELLDRLKEHQERLEVVEGNLTDAKTALESQELELRREIVGKVEELEMKENHLTEVRQGLLNKEEECAGLLDRMKQQQLNLENAERHLVEAKTALDDKDQELKSKLEVLENGRNEIDSCLETREREFRKLLEEQQVKLTTTEDELRMTREKLETAEQEHVLNLEELKTANDQLRAMFEGKEQECEKLAEAREVKQSRLDAAEEELCQMKTNLDSSEGELRLKLSEVEATNEQLREDLGNSEQKYQRVLDEMEVTNRNRLTALEASLADFKECLAAKEEALKKQSAELEMMRGELGRQGGSYPNNLAGEIMVGNVVNEGTVSVMESKRQEFESSLDQVRQLNEELKEDLRNRNIELERVLEELKTQKEMLEEASSQREAQANVAGMQSNALQRDLAETKEKLAIKEDEFLQLKNQIERINSCGTPDVEPSIGPNTSKMGGVPENQYEELQNLCSVIKAENEQLKTTAADKQLELQAHLEEAKKWQQSAGSMEMQLAEAGREFEHCEQELQKQRADVDAQRLELQQAGLETSNDVLQQQQPMTMDVVSMKEEFECRVQDLQREIDDLHAQREELQSRLEGMQSTGDDGTDHDLRLQDHQRKVEELQTQNESLEKLVEDHQAGIEELRKQNEFLEEHQKKIEELRRQNESLEELVEKYLKRIEELRTQNKSLEELLEGNEREMELWRTEADNQRRRLEGVITDSESASMAKEVTYQERIDALEDQKKELQESLANHKSQMECMNTSAAELEASKQESSSRIVELEMQVNVLEDEKKELQESLANHKSQVGSINTSAAELEASKQECFDRIVELEMQVNTLENEKKELQESLTNHESLVGSMNTSATELEASRQDCLKRIAELEMLQVTENGLVGEEVSSYRERIEVLEREKNDLQEELEKEVDRQTQLVDLEITIEDLKAEKEAAVAELEMKEQELEIAGIEAEKQMTELMAERDQINADLQDSINCSIDAQQELVKTQVALEESLEKLHSVQEKYEQLLASKDDSEHYTNTIECLQKEKGDLEKAISDIKQEKDKLYEDSHQQQEALVLRNEELEASKEGLTRKLEETENQLRELNNEAERLRGEGRHVVNDVEIKLSDEITSLQKEKEDLERIVNDLQQKLEDRVQDCKNNKREMEELGERNTELEIHLEELRELAEEQKEKYETEAKNEQLQHTSTVTILQNENSDLQQDITNLEQELQEHLHEKEETQKRLEELVENNIDLQNQLKELHEEQERSKETSENLEELTNTITRLQKEKLDLQQAGFALEQRLDELSEGNRSREETEDLLEKNVQLETKLKELKESAEREIEKYNILEKEKANVEKRLKKVEQAASSKYKMMLANIKTTQELHKQQEATEELLKKREERIQELEQRLQAKQQEAVEGLPKKREERIQELEQRLQSKGGDSQTEDLEASKRRIGDLTKSNSDLQKKLELQEKDMARKYKMLKSSVQRAQQLYGEEMAAREATEKRLEEEREKVEQMQQQQHQTQKGPILSTSTPGNHTKEELTDLVHELQAQQASNQRQIQQLEQIMKEAADPTAIASGSGVVASAVVPHLRTYNTKLEKENVEVEKQLRKVQELYKNERMKYAEMKEKKLYWKTEFQKVKISQLRNSSVSSPKKPLKDNNTPIITHHPAPPGKAQSVDCPGSSRTQENLHRATVRKAALASEEGPTDPSVSGQPTWLEEAYADLENPENCKQQ